MASVNELTSVTTTRSIKEELAELERFLKQENALSEHYAEEAEKARLEIYKNFLQKQVDEKTKSEKQSLDFTKELNKKEFAKERKEYEKRIKDLQELKAKAEGKDKDSAEKKAAEAAEAELREFEKIQNEKLELVKRRQAAEKAGQEGLNALTQKGLTLKERANAFKTENGDFNINSLVGGLANYTQQLNNSIDSIASKKGIIDTRLYGSNMQGVMLGKTGQSIRGGSYWDIFTKDITNIAGASTLIKQTDMANKLASMVDKGIAFNIEQRAFLGTISDKIATTFDATNGTLLRLVRIQQEDTTAARLGMEASLNQFLNNMYETTEYMSDLAASVKNDLAESMSLMAARDAVGYEYQVQKWLGSMYSVGMSNSAVGSISSAFGKLAAGQLEGVTDGGTGNLLIMAANNAGLSIADMLAKGLDESDTNVLMQSMVNYLAKIYGETADNRVVQQQYAKIFGITASDLKAAANLASSSDSVGKAFSGYDKSLKMLTSMANTMMTRVSLGEQLNNAFDNLQYTMAAGIASNPVLYSTFKVAGMLDDIAGGIALPSIHVVGSGVDLETTVSDLMMVGALSGSLLSGIGGIINSLAGSAIPAATLAELGVYGQNTISRGRNLASIITSGSGVSESGYVGNKADIYESTLAEANDTTKSSMAEAKESEDSDVTNKVINESIVSIYSLLQKVVAATEDSLNVTVTNVDQFAFSK